MGVTVPPRSARPWVGRGVGVGLPPSFMFSGRVGIGNSFGRFPRNRQAVVLATPSLLWEEFATSNFRPSPLRSARPGAVGLEAGGRQIIRNYGHEEAGNHVTRFLRNLEAAVLLTPSPLWANFKNTNKLDFSLRSARPVGCVAIGGSLTNEPKPTGRRGETKVAYFSGTFKRRFS